MYIHNILYVGRLRVRANMDEDGWEARKKMQRLRAISNIDEDGWEATKKNSFLLQGKCTQVETTVLLSSAIEY